MDEHEFSAPFDYGKPAPSQIGGPAIDAFDPLARFLLDIWKAELVCELCAGACQFAPTQQAEKIGAIDDLILLRPREILLDQPLPALGRVPRAPRAPTRHRALSSSACDDASDKPSGLRVGRVVDGKVGSTPRYPLLCHLTLHGFDDVSVLAHPAQYRLEIVGEVRLRRHHLLSQAETPQLLQAAGR